MILDERTEFCDNQSLNTGGAGTYNIGDQIDLGATQRNLGSVDQPLYLVVQVGATGIRVASGSGTVTFQMASDSTPTLSTDASQTIHQATRAFPTNTTSDANALKPGTVLAVFQVASGGPDFERYVGVQQVTGTTAISAGSVDAFLTMTPPVWKAYDAPFQV